MRVLDLAQFRQIDLLVVLLLIVVVRPGLAGVGAAQFRNHLPPLRFVPELQHPLDASAGVVLHGHLHALAFQEGVELGAQHVIGLFVVRFDPKLVPYRLGRSHDGGVLAVGLALRLERALLVARRLVGRIVIVLCIVLGIVTDGRPVLVVAAVVLSLLRIGVRDVGLVESF